MSPPLYLTIRPSGTSADGKHATFDVSLAQCRNCGKVKIAADPCGFDHLAAILEFRQHYLGEQP